MTQNKINIIYGGKMGDKKRFEELTAVQEMAQPYIASIIAEKPAKIFVYLSKIYNDLGLQDLQDLIMLNEILIDYMKYQEKVKIWGRKYEPTGDLKTSVRIFNELIDFLKKDRFDEQELARLNMLKIFGVD